MYILVSQVDGSLYTGSADDIPKRLGRHNKGLVKSTRSKKPYELGYFEIFQSRAEAMWREWELKKKWNTDRKKKLIAGFDPKKIRSILGL